MTGIDEIEGRSTNVLGRQDRLEMDSQRLLTVLLEHLSDGLLITDPNGLVILTNPALEQMLGRPGATLLRKPLPADLAPGIGPIIGQALETAPAPASGEIILNDERRIQVSASVFEGEAGAVMGVATTLRDVSRRRAAEQVKDTVLTAISHELRTPLASIVGFVALANKTLHERLAPHISPESPMARRALDRIADHLHRIDESGRRLEGMVNDLLDLADMEAGRGQWDMADVSLLDVIHTAMFTVTPQAKAKDLTIHLSLVPDLPVVRGDRVRLTQVVTHLLSNAIKFTHQGEAQIAVETLKVNAKTRGSVPVSLTPGEYLLVKVTDTGPGISAEVLPHLFEKFFQPTDRLTGKPPGIGLGLALCREIVEHHGGKIWVKSEPGAGSTFSFALPRSAQARSARPILLRELRRWLAAASSESAASPRVLVAHADGGLQRLLVGGLGPDDLTLLLAPDGETCRRILQSEAPSLLVLDPFLPDLDVLRGLDLPPTLLLGVVRTDDAGLRVALGEVMSESIGVDLALRSLRSYLALTWDDRQPEGRILILDAGAPSLGGIAETLQAQGFKPVVFRTADASGPDQAVLDAVLALLRPDCIQSTTHYRNPQRDLCTLMLVEF
jgi:signal transduction histidine kinase